MYKLEKCNVVLIGAAVLILFSIFLVVNSFMSNEKKAELIPVNFELNIVKEKKQIEAELIQNYLQQKNGFFDQVNKRLVEKGYAFQMLGAVHSQDDIQVKFILEDQEVTEKEQEEIQRIFFNLVELNNLDANAFTVKIEALDDDQDW